MNPESSPGSGSGSRAESPTPPSTSGGSGQPRKGGLSCAECRRSKLKCDRKVPCQACVRRGCPAICPDGTLMATKGNKVLQARAEKLGEQVKTMTSRIAELEQQIAEAQRNLRLASSTATGASRVLESNSREPDAPNEQMSNLVDAIGSLAINIHTEGGTKYYGSTSSSEYLTTLLPGDGTENVIERLRDPKYLGLPDQILQLVYAFPLGMRDCPYSKSIFLPFFPDRDRASALVDIYYRLDAWQFQPLLCREIDDIVVSIYDSGYPIIEHIHPHKLSVFFSLMALGAAFSPEPVSMEREQYHALACAMISLEPITRGVTCSTVQAFFLIVRFLYSTVRTAGEDCWILFGMCVRVSQMMGLQYDGVAWGLEREEIQRRRTLFWEVYTWNCWNAFVMGRPPSIYLEDTDCKFPNHGHCSDSEVKELDFHAWKYRYTAACLPWTLKHAFSPGSVSYDALMELDCKIRTFPIPSRLKVSLEGEDGHQWSADSRLAMQQCNTVFMKETNLLYLHRSFFAVAVRDNSLSPLDHMYGPSVIATYRSALRMCVALRGLYLVHPDALARYWYFWSCIFSSCLVLAALVYGSPGCSFAQEALMELNSAAAFYEEGSAACRPPRSTYALAKFKRRAREAFTAYHAPKSSHPTSEPSADECWGLQLGHSDQQLEILGGVHGVVNHSTSRHTQSSVRSDASLSPDTSMHDTFSTTGPATSYERLREPEAVPPAAGGVGGQLPMQYHDTSMHILQGISPLQPVHSASFQMPHMPMVDPPMNQMDPMAYYNYGFGGASSSSPAQQQPVISDASSTTNNRQHIWKSFIQGLMED
ncbi:fungal-specific transcription factor domain-containing protein [Cristinia sonorae]|uniref:Fungal-specific transcription factor domain-containing protein n=1 Tax=Cristinia sonorae TaxID=1940300 RepID=A0A8K0XSU5_9AGAR|nr:fungal-specific transcription factor domain-containing protein [Cristinia sonorae]